MTAGLANDQTEYNRIKLAHIKTEFSMGASASDLLVINGAL